jgi:hypothetical protein
MTELEMEMSGTARRELPMGVLLISFWAPEVPKSGKMKERKPQSPREKERCNEAKRKREGKQKPIKGN